MLHSLKNNNTVMNITICFLFSCSIFLTSTVAIAASLDNLDKIINHLEFLGYKISKDGDKIITKHEKHIKFSLKKYRGGILFTAYFGGNKISKTDRGSYLEFINSLNVDAGVSRFYADKDGDLAIEAYMQGAYEKTTFSNFLDRWNEDTERILIKHVLEATKYLK